MTEANTTEDLLDAVRANPQRFKTVGWVLLGMGVLSILFPLASSVAYKAMLGWLILISGAVVLYHAFQSKDWQSALLSGLVGVIQIAGGVYLGFFPFTGLVGLTVFLAIMFLMQGGMELGIALQHRDREGWIWLLLSAAASGLVGIMLLTGLPGTALWAIGLLVGINLLTSGFAFHALVRAAEAPKS